MHGTVVSVLPDGKKLSREALSDWRSADIDAKLRATLGFVEKLTLSPDQVASSDAAAVREAGVSERAMIDAIYVCVGFNVINRIADALDFRVPTTYSGGAIFLRLFGYKFLSGSFLSRNGTHAGNYAAASGAADSFAADPYRAMCARLIESVLCEPGPLDREAREAALSGLEVRGTLGDYVGKVMRGVYSGVDADMAALKSEGYSEDRIFEATVSAALGAGLRRRDAGLVAVRDSAHATRTS